jgi:hypothetical protein
MRPATSLLSLTLAALLPLASACSSTITGGEPGAEADAGPDFVPQADAGTCAEVRADLTRTVPTVLLLVDRSGSMDKSFGGDSRWNAVYKALLNGSGSLVSRLQNDVRFGLTTFTSSGGVCPRLNMVAPTVGNYGAIEGLFRNLGPDGETPTGESLALAAQQMSLVTEPGKKAIIIATDGEPDTCADPQGDGSAAARTASINAAVAAHANGVDVYVISVGAQVALDHLQRLANVGVGLPESGGGNAPYYPANSPDQLTAAFDQIVEGVQSCSFTLNGSIDPDQASGGVVTLDGTELPYGTSWTMSDPTTIELLGSACDALQLPGDHSVEAKFTCGFSVE